MAEDKDLPELHRPIEAEVVPGTGRGPSSNSTNPVLRFIGLAFFFNLLLWLFALFVQVRGWVGLSASYLILGAIWFVGTVICYGVAVNSRIYRVRLATLVSSLALAAALVGLNAVAPKPLGPVAQQNQNPPKAPAAEQPPPTTATQPTQRPAQPQQPSVPVSKPLPRSYLVFDGHLQFPKDRDESSGSLSPERNFRIGDQLRFNFSYKALGPNLIHVFSTSRWIYVEPDSSDATQEGIVRDFEQHVARDWKEKPRLKEIYTQMHEGDGGQWNTAFAYTEDRNPRLVTQADLDNFRTGAAVVFVVVQIPYKDNEKWHYLKTCQYLIPPGTLPAVWHFCNYFTNSD
jgi:hypothetical protein